MLYHIVYPSKYRRKVAADEVSETIKNTCIEISQRCEIRFIKIGMDKDHVHFLVQSVPMMLATRIVQTIKSITAKEVFKKHPQVKQVLWGGNFWTSGYYINTVGQYGNEQIISNYVKKQSKKYNQIYRSQLTLFEGLT